MLLQRRKITAANGLDLAFVNLGIIVHVPVGSVLLKKGQQVCELTEGDTEQVDALDVHLPVTESGPRPYHPSSFRRTSADRLAGGSTTCASISSHCTFVSSVFCARHHRHQLHTTVHSSSQMTRVRAADWMTGMTLPRETDRTTALLTRRQPVQLAVVLLLRESDVGHTPAHRPASHTDRRGWA